MEYRHFSHREHALRFEYGDSYTCDGCREEGYGFRYRCRPCDFDMHESCARAPQSTRHFIDTQHDLVFKEKPGLAHVECDVCREKIEGFVYECRGCNIDLHPSCARLPHSLRHADAIRTTCFNSCLLRVLDMDMDMYVMHVDKVLIVGRCAIAARVLRPLTSFYTFPVLNYLWIRWKR